MGAAPSGTNLGLLRHQSWAGNATSAQILTVSSIVVLTVAPAGVVTSSPRVASTAPVPAAPPTPAPIAAPFLPPAIAPIAVPTPAPMPIFVASSPFVAAACATMRSVVMLVRRLRHHHLVEADRHHARPSHGPIAPADIDNRRVTAAPAGITRPFLPRRPASRLSHGPADRASLFGCHRRLERQLQLGARRHVHRHRRDDRLFCRRRSAHLGARS